MGIRQLHLAEGNRVLTVSLIALCIIGIVGSWFQGAREHSDARIAQEKQEHIASSVDDVRKSLALGSVSPEEVLAAAAAKISEQDKRIKALEHPAHDPQEIYQNNIPVATVGQILNQDPNHITFKQITTMNGRLDLGQELEFQEWRLRCTGVPGGGVGFGTTVHWDYFNVSCLILGSR
jgi:hypothetical protein